MLTWCNSSVSIASGIPSTQQLIVRGQGWMLHTFIYSCQNLYRILNVAPPATMKHKTTQTNGDFSPYNSIQQKIQKRWNISLFWVHSCSSPGENWFPTVLCCQPRAPSSASISQQLLFPAPMLINDLQHTSAINICTLKHTQMQHIRLICCLLFKMHQMKFVTFPKSHRASYSIKCGRKARRFSPLISWYVFLIKSWNHWLP